MQILFRLRAYFRYWKKAINAHGIHSPFVFTLYNEVIASDQEYYAFEEIEQLRNELRTNGAVIDLTDLGAGSALTSQNKRTVASLASRSACSPAKGRLLFKLVNFIQPDYIVELGTSLGIGSLYLHSAKRKANFYTLEGDAQLAKIALQNFQKQQTNINLIVGNINDTLPTLLKDLPAFDFVFFDANHRYAPTIQYFELCLSKVHENTVFVFDDIYWSKEMEKAWQTIHANPHVQLSIDLFDVGIVFFRKNQPKQHFILK